MDAVEYLKQLKRMCKDRKCNECPLSKNIYAIRQCVPSLIKDEKMNVEIVEEWAKEHPEKTRQSEFLKMFPNAVTHDGVLTFPPCMIDHTMSGDRCEKTNCDECTRKYWTEKIE